MQIRHQPMRSLQVPSELKSQTAGAAARAKVLVVELRLPQRFQQLLLTISRLLKVQVGARTHLPAFVQPHRRSPKHLRRHCAPVAVSVPAPALDGAVGLHAAGKEVAQGDLLELAWWRKGLAAILAPVSTV